MRTAHDWPLMSDRCEICITRTEWRWVAMVSSLILAVTIAPILWAFLTTPPGYHFIGFMYNWDEANPYLAKIVQGARGEWLYSLPYSADPGEPFFLYFNYLLLGRLATWLNVEPIVAFHLARLLDSVVLLVTLYWFAARFFAQTRERQIAFLLAAFGAGFGWLLIGFRYVAADLWQTQIFPFLAMLANVHFPLAMAAQLWLIDALFMAPRQAQHARGVWLPLGAGSLILALTQPYGLIVTAIMILIWIALRCWRDRHMLLDLLTRFALMVALAVPFALYYRWLALNNAAYAGWDQQNVTLSSPPWDYALSGGLIFLLGLLGAIFVARRWLARRSVGVNDFILLSWPLVTIALMYLPITQQRRFAFALSVPFALLAVKALAHLPRLNTSFARMALVAFSSLSNIVLLVLALIAIHQRAPFLFFTDDEWHGLLYLRAHADPQAVVLASAEMGLYIPAWAGQRVVYGHPHETLDAKTHRAEVERFFAGTLTDTAALLNRVDFIFVGPRERLIGAPSIPSFFAPVFGEGDVIIYGRR